MFRFAAAISLVLTPVALQAQTWRTFEASRPLADSGEHRVRIDYGGGYLDIHSTDQPVLYTMRMRYDDANATPVAQYETDSRLATLGLANRSTRFRHRDARNELNVSLSRVAPIVLDVNLGAAETRMDLGGLALREVRVTAGTSASTLDFSSPNSGPMRQLDIHTGAARLEALNLANAGAPEIQVMGSAGDVLLDFGGSWSQDVAVDANIRLGKLEFRVPDDVGVRVEVRRVIGSLKGKDLTKRTDGYYSTNWDTATYKLRIHARTLLGEITVTRRPPTLQVVVMPDGRRGSER
ncbi:MAG TPA: LiaF domain-containing protein [Gemmatimonadaceae bacterium]|nr:LiaF domain-containing protein [Gemmatimonadaceae bacterium]